METHNLLFQLVEEEGVSMKYKHGHMVSVITYESKSQRQAHVMTSQNYFSGKFHFYLEANENVLKHYMNCSATKQSLVQQCTWMKSNSKIKHEIRSKNSTAGV